MFEILKSFKLYEPATTTREILNFNSNYTIGRAIDFSDSSSFVFNSSLNDFIYDGITFNAIYPVDKYGAQENFIFNSKGLRRKEMWWESSTHPVSTGPNPNDGFMLYGKYIAIKKISDIESFNMYIESITAVSVFVESYNTTTGEISFKYNSLPSLFEEVDSNNIRLYDFTNYTWYQTVFDQSIQNNTIKTLYKNFTSDEKITEISINNISIDYGQKIITGTTQTGLSQEKIDSIDIISPYTQNIRFTVIGEYNIEKNSTTNINEAIPITNLQTRSSLGVSSFIYIDLPYQNNNTPTVTSSNFKVRTPSIKISFSTGDMILLCIMSEKTGNSNSPDGFKVRIG